MGERFYLRQKADLARAGKGPPPCTVLLGKNKRISCKTAHIRNRFIYLRYRDNACLLRGNMDQGRRNRLFSSKKVLSVSTSHVVVPRYLPPKTCSLTFCSVCFPVAPRISTIFLVCLQSFDHFPNIATSKDSSPSRETFRSS